MNMYESTLHTEPRRCYVMSSKHFVIKCGGSTLAALPDSFFIDMKQLQEQGQTPVIVHGGGPAISEILSKLQIETEFVNGLRKTTNEVLDVVEMVLSGSTNKEVVRRIQRIGAKALGLSGVDGHLIHAVPVGNTNEIGYVGEVEHIDVQVI